MKTSGMYLKRNPTSSRRINILIVSIFLLLGFVFFSKEANHRFFKSTDFDFTIKLQERIDKSSRLRLSAFVGNVMEGATFFASPEFTVVITLGLTAAAWVLRKKNRWLALAILLALIFLVGGELIGKTIVHHPSPPFSMIKHPTSFFPENYINEQFSYPSGHAARAVFLSVIGYSIFIIHNSKSKKKQYRVLLALGCMTYVVLVAASRIYLGHHWLSDVIGGVLLGSGIGVFALSFLYINRPTESIH